MPVGGVHRGTLEALKYAKTLSDDVTAVHIALDPEEAKKVARKWETWGDGYRLVMIHSPYRLFIEPLLEYVDSIDKIRKADEIITIVVPQFISHRWWSSFLHTRTAESLRKSLLNHEHIVITEVPYQVK